MVTTGAYHVDIRLHEAIVQEFAAYPWLATAGVGIAVHVGVVHLTGTVDTYARKWAVTDIVQRLPGVQRVENALVVGSPDSGADLTLHEEIRQTLPLFGQAPRDEAEAALPRTAAD